MEHIAEFDGKERTYHSRVRQRQAEETRQRILEAARSPFESYGYILILVPSRASHRGNETNRVF